MDFAHVPVEAKMLATFPSLPGFCFYGSVQWAVFRSKLQEQSRFFNRCLDVGFDSSRCRGQGLARLRDGSGKTMLRCSFCRPLWAFVGQKATVPSRRTRRHLQERREHLAFGTDTSRPANERCSKSVNRHQVNMERCAGRTERQ